MEGRKRIKVQRGRAPTPRSSEHTYHALRIKRTGQRAGRASCLGLSGPPAGGGTQSLCLLPYHTMGIDSPALLTAGDSAAFLW